MHYAFSTDKVRTFVILSEKSASVNYFSNNRSQMRLCTFFLLLLVVAASSLSQSLFEAARPDITILVEQHPSSAQLVEITLLDSDFPTNVLTAQCQKLGSLLGVAPRGLWARKSGLETDPPSSRFLKAGFAINGLTDKTKGTLQVQAILQSFCGGSAGHETKQFNILFADWTPSTDTVKTYVIPGVLKAEGRYNSDQHILEYMVQLLTVDASKISFPSNTTDVPAPKKSADNAGSSNVLPMVALLAIGAIAIGALVYLALLRPGVKPPR